MVDGSTGSSPSGDDRDGRPGPLDAHERLRKYATWLHDDVLPELGLLRMRLVTGALTLDEALDEFDDLEHRLRVRQLEAELAAGGIPLATVLQPYIRMAQRAGLAITAVPSHDEARIIVSGSTGYEVKRFLAVAVPNAILAGAQQIGFHFHDGERPATENGQRSRGHSADHSPGAFRLTVSDDAGGIDLSDPTHFGRGRANLANELGPDRLVTSVDGDGTHFSCQFG